jgi:uncharacterized protein YndB with AHSA1/START domain
MKLTIEPAGDRHIRITRELAAPPELVWRAHTEPALIRRWLGTPRLDWHTCEVDARPGGRFRYTWTRARDGWIMGMSGIYDVLEPPSLIVHREIFDEDWTGGEVIVSTTFHPLPGGRTRLEMLLEHTSAQARDRVLQTGMAEGMEESYVLLDEVLGS